MHGGRHRRGGGMHTINLEDIAANIRPWNFSGTI
jgi:hypothetical protein